VDRAAPGLKEGQGRTATQANGTLRSLAPTVLVPAGVILSLVTVAAFTHSSLMTEKYLPKISGLGLYVIDT